MTSLHCDATAYVSVLSIHNASTHSTSLATETAKDLLQRDTSGLLRMARRMLLLILVLVRSLRAVEPPGCRRPFVLLGVLPSLPPLWRARLTREGVVFAPCAPLVPGNPASDKLRAWLLVRYERLLYVDADVMALANVDDVLAPAPPHVVVQAHHESDLVQAHCGVPLAQRCSQLCRLQAARRVERMVLLPLEHAAEVGRGLAVAHEEDEGAVSCSLLPHQKAV